MGAGSFYNCGKVVSGRVEGREKMSEDRPEGSYLFQCSNRGSKLKDGFYIIDEAFITDSMGKESGTCPIVLQFHLPIRKILRDDVVHLSLHFTLDDAKRLYAEFGAAIQTRELKKP